MSCHDVDSRLDAFIDSELPPSEQVDVARHVAGCSACDGTVRGLLALRGALTETSATAASTVDLQAIWPGVERALDEQEGAHWGWRRAGRAVPLWAAGMAMAAGALLVLRGVRSDESALTTLAETRGRNPVVIERLAGRDIAVRREIESGTTLIWVNHVRQEVGGR